MTQDKKPQELAFGEDQYKAIPAIKSITIGKLCEITGYTKGAIQAKIHRGDWVEGKEYTKAPDGRNLVLVDGYNQWAKRGNA